MTPPFSELVQPLCRVANDGEARVTFVGVSAGGREVLSLHGTLDGPHCMQARTLPTVFRLHPRRDPGGASAECLITDPCYWTPALPFLYILVVEIELPDGSTATVSQTVGLRRLQADGANLRLERRRIVLRGAALPGAEASMLSTARTEEVTLVVRDPGEAICKEASRLGLGLVADLRGAQRDVTASLRRYSWQPAVLAALLDDSQAEHAAASPAFPLIAAAVGASDNAAEGNRPWAGVLACELQAGERPPTWLAACGKPVVAIRRGVDSLDLPETRAACDQLQAELAPQFSLAGYFVASQ